VTGPVLFDDAGGQRSGREAHNLTAEGSTPSPATIPRPLLFEETAVAGVAKGWENVSRISQTDGQGIVRAAVAPLRRHVVLHRNFDLDVHNILDYAEHQLLEGEALDLDHVADLIARKVRESLHIVYGPGEER
jgi:hypothetical protein